MENLKYRMEFFSKEFPELMKKFSNPFKNIADAFKVIEEKTPNSLLELSRFGWYVDLSMLPREPIELAEKLKEGDINYVDSYLTEYYSNSITEIKKKLIKNHPARITLIKEAFKTYQAGSYSSSIVLFLTQIDGICYDRAKKMYFTNNRALIRKRIYIPEIEGELNKLTNGIIQLLIKPIGEPTLINEATKNLSKYSERLNRHEIIHGIDIEYGTYIKNLKIISLISYFSDIINSLD